MFEIPMFIPIEQEKYIFLKLNVCIALYTGYSTTEVQCCNVLIMSEFQGIDVVRPCTSVLCKFHNFVERQIFATVKDRFFGTLQTV